MCEGLAETGLKAGWQAGEVMSGEYSLEREKAGWHGRPTYIFERGREAGGIRQLKQGQGADTRCVFNYFFVLNDIGPAESPRLSAYRVGRRHGGKALVPVSSRPAARTHTRHARRVPVLGPREGRAGVSAGQGDRRQGAATGSSAQICPRTDRCEIPRCRASPAGNF